MSTIRLTRPDGDFLLTVDAYLGALALACRHGWHGAEGNWLASDGQAVAAALDRALPALPEGDRGPIADFAVFARGGAFDVELDGY